MKKVIILIGALAIALTACNKSETEKGMEVLEQARTFYNNKEYTSAKVLLDSLERTYPKDVKIQRERLNLVEEVELAESERNILFVDSMIAQTTARLQEMLPAFAYEKKEEYDDLGRYIDKTYNPTFQNANQFLKVEVNEVGELSLISGFSGSTINHTQLKVSDAEGAYAESTVLAKDDVFNRSFQDGTGRHYETLTFQKGADNGVLMFIYNNVDKKLTLQRLGGKKTAPVVLSDKEKASVKRLTDLSLVVQDLVLFQKEKNNLEKRIEYLNNKRKTTAE